MDFSIFELVSEYIFKLTPRDLTRIYWNGARLWLDTGDGDLQLTFGPPRDRGAHPRVDEEPAVGQWVWVGLGPDCADEHPLDEEGDCVDDWSGLVDWMRGSLEYCLPGIADELQMAAERAEELS